MIIGVPKEVKDHETRVGLVPSGVAALREAGHEVLVETHAGEGSSITDREYMQVGAAILQNAAEVWHKADLIVKVKEPQPSEYGYFRPGLILLSSSANTTTLPSRQIQFLMANERMANLHFSSLCRSGAYAVQGSNVIEIPNRRYQSHFLRPTPTSS